tara:strand:+ start:8 stop:112 length:105 start_codon:yes stop_codon:yes gene_type:complete
LLVEDKVVDLTVEAVELVDLEKTKALLHLTQQVL